MPYLIQRAIAVVGLVVLGPLILLFGVAVRLTSPGPAFHRATRVRPGGTFTLYKLRTMRVRADRSGPAITAAGDHRVTRFGRVLRRSKIDELPQLWNVVRGDMALVGPRPEDPRYVDLADPLHATVFNALPGITGPTALAYRDEESILAKEAQELAHRDGRDRATECDLDRAYREIILPAKLRMDREYLETRSTMSDVSTLLATVRGRPSEPSRRSPGSR
jgi:lipopolysaccharide/colanic/teichoic acid biosynthesis glycosyltransferase